MSSASANNPLLRLQLPPSLPLLGTIPPALAYPPVSPRPASRAGSNRPTQAFVALNSPLAGRVPVPSLPLHQQQQQQSTQSLKGSGSGANIGASADSEDISGGESVAVASLSTATATLSINTASSPVAAVPPTQMHAAPALAAPKLLLPPTPRAANYFAPPLSARGRDTAKPRPNDEREAVRTYLSQHRIPEIFQTLCEELALTRPDDPLAYMAHSFASAQYIDLAVARCTSIADAADPLTYAPDELSTAADGTLVSVSRGGDADGESSNATSLSTPFPSSLPAPYFSQGVANTNAAVASHRAESGLRPVPAVPAAVTASTPRHSNAHFSFSSSSSSSASSSSPRAVAFGIDLSATLSGHSNGSNISGSGSGGDAISMQTMRALLDANTRIGAALDPYRATAAIVDECCRLCDCERATIFLVNETRRELEVRVAKGEPQIFLPLGQGVAGHCAQSGLPVLVPDAYADARFSADADARTGFRTRNIVAVPIKMRDGEETVVGVLQCVNKNGGAAFSEAVDVYILSMLGAQAGVTLRNAMMVDVALAERRKSRALLDIVHTLNQGGGGGSGDGGDSSSSAVSVSSQIFTVIARTTDLVDSDRTTFFLVDRRAGELWSMQGSINLRFPITKGLAGAVARTGEVINIPDAYKDARFNQETDRRTGYHTQTVLVMPMFGSASAGGAAEGAIVEGANENEENAQHRGTSRMPVIGVLQVINKKDGTAFDEADEEVLKMFLAITGPILEKSTMYQQLARPVQSKEAALAFGGGGGAGSGLTPRRSVAQKQNVTIVGFAEEDETEEES